LNVARRATGGAGNSTPSGSAAEARDDLALNRLLEALTAMRDGNFRRRLRAGSDPLLAEISAVYNDVAERQQHLANELARVRRAVGRDGRLDERLAPGTGGGDWSASIDAANALVDDLVRPTVEIARVLAAVAEGDLTQRLELRIDDQPLRGEFLRMGRTVNGLVDQLSAFADEVTRVAREVGTEGKLGGQAKVRRVSGSWRDLTDSVNTMAGRLTAQVRDIALVTTAVANGDLSRKVTVEVAGEMLELKQTVNRMVDQLSALAAEVTRVAREVGSEGKLGGQAAVKGVSGTWKDLTDSVNFMAGNLTAQVRDIAQVTTAVARGDLSQKITVDVKGELLQLKSTVNTMVDQLSAFAAEVTRVAREVGSEGRLGGQADVPGVAGTWRDLTDSVNFMAGTLTAQVRNIAEVTTAVAKGDLTRTITVDARGEILELKNTVNTMVGQLSAFADEVTRVAREVGTDGRLGGQAMAPAVGGTWRDLTDSVNGMAGNLTSQVRNIAQVATAVAKGDLSQKITVDARGEILELKNTLNTMVDQLSGFAAEVTRVAREVGTDGRLGGQADVKGVSGTWKDLTESVNVMAGNLTAQVRNIAQVTTAVARGDLSRKITVDARGEILELKDTVNIMVDQLSAFADEVTRVAREVGTEGNLGGQAYVRGVSGTWKDLTDNVNSMAGNLTSQVRSIAQVATGVARGDLSSKIDIVAKGEVAALASTINTMVDTLRAFAHEVTRVAREVGTEGSLGGQAYVPGVAGTWKDLTDNVNSMAGNLTRQVRSIALVTTAVANGDLGQKIDVDARGEILQLKTTINRMVDQLSAFAAEVTRVAREVGTEGKLGGQAEVEGVSGTWKKLTENVNQLAGTLTTQLRAIAEVSTAVTRGDLTRQITVDASGEVADLKNNINQMIANLRETTRTNEEQDWLKTNLARISGLMQGRRDLMDVARLIMSELTPLVSAQHGAFFLANDDRGDPELRLIATYGYKARKNVANRFRLGEALVGQAALERKPILITEPPRDYIRVTSGLGEAPPVNIIVLPVFFEGRVLGVIELGSFSPFSEVHQSFLDQLMESIGVSLNAIMATSRTEELLAESQRLAAELREKSEELEARQGELQQTNAELEDKASLLADQNRAIEIKNAEIEEARRVLEERAEQFLLSSRYKSEFLANMSHELRTPLNSLLILAKLLSDNSEGNLTSKQIEFAQTIHDAGSDLLELINDILDLSKVEAGKMDIGPTDVPVARMVEYVEATFCPLTADKNLRFSVLVADDVPAFLHTDELRLQQVLRNLLSNAVKFTDTGEVQLLIRRADAVALASPALAAAEDVVAFSVVDTGIGISADKLRVIFEAFQQADGTTSRKYGGTGLGLSISREIARLLGGEIHAQSELGHGSTFTLYLPARLDAAAAVSAVSAALLPAPPPQAAIRPGTPTPAGPPAASVAGRTGRTADPPAAGGLFADVAIADGSLGEVVSGPPVAPRLLDAVDVPDDRDNLRPGDRVLLVVVEDSLLAESAVRVGRRHGFRVLATLRPEQALDLARELVPAVAIVELDQVAPDGTPIFAALKRSPDTRHIPVQVVAPDADPGQEQAAIAAGALGVLAAPVTAEALESAVGALASFLDEPVRRLLAIEPDEGARSAIVELVKGADVSITAVSSAGDAAEVIRTERFDCVVVGAEQLDQLAEHAEVASLPRVTYRPGDSARLVEQTALYLHRNESARPASRRRMIEHACSDDLVFAGRAVLIVDDDVRAVFALTSTLERHGLSVIYAENGRAGVEALERHPGIDLVLMDVMMPEMDGYETTAAMRAMPQFAKLPIIALTAKAMKGDREKSIAAGASDYVAKPVDVDRLLALLRVWLGRRSE
jgi:HAMP domain-containing protein/signal transduction histidine kinase/CheY-like chemotaxis protein